MTLASVPVVLVHGWGGSFAETWQQSGVVDLLADAGRTVIGVDLLGHGAAPKPHDPAEYSDLTRRILDVLPDGPIDAVGFSLGAMTLLQLAVEHPGRLRRLVVAGVGANLFRRDDGQRERILAGIEGTADADDVAARVFAGYAHRPGQDPMALAAVLKREGAPQLTPERLLRIECPVLVAIGDKDFAGPGDPLVEALPSATLAVLRNVDHFATPESFAFIDAMLGFLERD